MVGSGNLPTDWQNVPFTDVNCQASNVGVDTPDVTDETGPAAQNGVMGNPYSGSTFVSALFGGQAQGSFYHEGIMQEVSGFTVGNCYTVNFYQTVVKQLLTDYLDTTGAWSVYLDDDFIGTTAPTTSNEPYASTSMPWEFRTLSFVASATTHTIKFLPADDDPDQLIDNPLGGLRMGIDSIYIGSTMDQITLDLGSDPAALCIGQPLVLDATNANATYLWQDGSTDPTFTVLFATPQEATYWVEVSTACGSLRDSVHLYYAELPVADLGNDTILCLNETLPIHAANTNATYLWQDGSTEFNFHVSQPGTYWVEVSNDCGIVRDSIEVGYAPLPEVDLGADTVICAGDTVTLDANAANATFLWHDNSTASTFQVSEEGSYWVQVSAGCGMARDTVLISRVAPPSFDLGQDTGLCAEETLLLDVSTANASYQWQNGSPDPSFLVTEAGVYWVTLTTVCSATDTIVIDQLECEVELEIPNVITPNGDALNDFWMPSVSTGIVSMTTDIYSRWGLKIHSTDDLHIGWDAKNVSAGVYYYIIRYTTVNGVEERLHGYLMVLR